MTPHFSATRGESIVSELPDTRHRTDHATPALTELVRKMQKAGWTIKEHTDDLGEPCEKGSHGIEQK